MSIDAYQELNEEIAAAWQKRLRDNLSVEERQSFSDIGPFCDAESDGYACCKDAGHAGRHLACRTRGGIIKEWTS